MAVDRKISLGSPSLETAADRVHRKNVRKFRKFTTCSFIRLSHSSLTDPFVRSEIFTELIILQIKNVELSLFSSTNAILFSLICAIYKVNKCLHIRTRVFALTGPIIRVGYF